MDCAFDSDRGKKSHSFERQPESLEHGTPLSIWRICSCTRYGVRKYGCMQTGVCVQRSAGLGRLSHTSSPEMHMQAQAKILSLLLHIKPNHRPPL